MKQCSSDARTMGHTAHSPFEFTATGMGEKGKTLVGRAQSGTSCYLPEKTTGNQRERGIKKPEVSATRRTH